MKNRPYYLVLGSTDFITQPFDRVIGLNNAIKAVRAQRANGFECFYLSAGKYRELTGRCASSDYNKQNSV